MRIIALSTFILFGLSLASCGPARNASTVTAATSKAQCPIAMEVGFDPTPPNADARARVAAETLPEIASGTNGFVLRAIDHRTDLVATAAPEDEDAAYDILKDIIRQMIPDTDLCKYFEVVEAACRKTPQKVIVVLYTDGLDDGKPGEAVTRLRKAATNMAGNRNLLAVVIVGLVRDTRRGWIGLPDMLAPLDAQGKKLHVISQADMSPERVRTEIEAIKTAAGCR